MSRATKAKGSRTYVYHADHTHPATKAARARCKRSIEQTGQPWDGVDRDPTPGTPEFDALPRGQKSAIRRRHNQKQATQAGAVDDLLDASIPNPMRKEAEASTALDKGDGGTYSLPGEVAVGEPVRRMRDANGRFTQATLDRWTDGPCSSSR
jgi:hypothetical protein